MLLIASAVFYWHFFKKINNKTATHCSLVNIWKTFFHLYLKFFKSNINMNSSFLRCCHLSFKADFFLSLLVDLIIWHWLVSHCFLPQAHGNVFSVVNPLASSITSSITSSLASSIGSDSSSPTTLSTMNAKATPFYPGSNTVESVIGKSCSTFILEPSSRTLHPRVKVHETDSAQIRQCS